MVFRAVSIGLAASLSAALTFAQPVSGMLDGTKAPAKAAAGTPTGSPLSPENRGDILMARKMYREAVETFGEGPPGDPVLRNKTGIAYHQLMQLDSAVSRPAGQPVNPLAEYDLDPGLLAVLTEYEEHRLRENIAAL